MSQIGSAFLFVTFFVIFGNGNAQFDALDLFISL